MTAHAGTDESATAEPIVEVVIEIPRWSFLKRGPSGRIDFLSPLPCPYNYGSIPDRVGLEGDLLDAVVLGPRLPRGTRLRIPARGAIGMAERGLYDDKLVCSTAPVTQRGRARLLRFFRAYSRAKRCLNALRGLPTDGRCCGWDSADSALGRSVPRDEHWPGPRVPF